MSAVTSAHQAEIAELTDCLSVLLARVADEQRRRQGAEERAEAAHSRVEVAAAYLPPYLLTSLPTYLFITDL